MSPSGPVLRMQFPMALAPAQDQQCLVIRRRSETGELADGSCDSLNG